MKYFALVAILVMSACTQTGYDLESHLEAEADFAQHQYHTRQAAEKNYDPEYVDDCYYYEDLVCEFE